MEILLADDDAQLRSLLSAYLGAQGWSVTSVSTGEDAIRLIATRPFDVIVTDVRMPGASGLDVLRAVRSQLRHSQVVLMTGYRSLSAAIEAVNQGAFAYIEKPFSLVELREKVIQAFRAKTKIENEEHKRQELETLVEEKEEELSLLRERSKAILEQMPLFIVLLDNSGTLKDANEKFFSAFGSHRTEAVSKPLCVALGCPLARAGPCSEPCDLWEAFLKAALDGRPSGKFTFRLPFAPLTGRGRTIFEVNIVPLPIKGHSPQGPKEFALIMEDVTKEKNMEVQLLHSSRLASLGEMATGIAHELSQPLNAISAQSQLLRFKVEKKGGLSKESIIEAVEDITAQVFRISDLLQHLRSYAQKASDSWNLLRPRDVVEASLKLIRSQIRAWGIELQIEEEEGLPLIQGDLNKLSHAVTNVLVNARDAVRQKALNSRDPSLPKRITINLTQFRRHTIPWVCVEITDNGIGMEPWVLDRAFDPMFSTKAEGTGVGLPIAASIMHSHGGDIRIETTPGEGTTVRLELPGILESQ